MERSNLRTEDDTMRTHGLSFGLFFALLHGALSATPVLFIEGIVLPGITRSYSTTDKNTAAQLAHFYQTQEVVIFLIPTDNEITSNLWGASGCVSACTTKIEGEVAKTDCTLQLKNMVQIFHNRNGLQAIPLRPNAGDGTQLEANPRDYGEYPDSPHFNRLPSKIVDEVGETIHRKYRTKAFRNDLAAVTTINQLIQVLTSRLDLEINPRKALEFLTRTSIQDKLNLLMQLLSQQNRTAQSAGDESIDQANQFRDTLEMLALDKATNDYLSEVIDRYENTKQNPHENPALETFLRFALSLPWQEAASKTPESFDLEKVSAALDEYQYGMEQVKDIVLTHLALRMISHDGMPFVLCLVGAPGTGKTSICQNIARALNKKIYRLSLGGVHSQSDITGFNRTYVGATEGKIMRGLKTMGSANGVIILDEIDKLATDNRAYGSPADALLHALDPEQNTHFFDDYLGVPFNISKTLFIATANNERNIPKALADRMIMVQVPSYTREEKIAIAQKMIIPRMLQKVALSDTKLEFSPEVIGALIDNYTFEEGLRGLSHQLNFLIGKYARNHLAGKETVFTPENLSSFLGSAHNNLVDFKRKAKILQNDLPDATRVKLFKAIDAFDQLPERTSEYERLRYYINTVLSLPWKKEPDQTNYDAATVASAIDATHYGTEKVKEAILDYLALAQRSNGKKHGSILCLVGPPGVGKTSTVQALAGALNKKMASIAMGTIASPLDLRGIAAEYSTGHIGKITQALIDSESKQGLILLDEIDKIPHISIANTLLDILDPSQNKAFLDDYIGTPIDLSQILFVATANDIQDIPYPLYDRMTIVPLEGYTARQKREIAQRYLLPKLLKESNITQAPFITPELIDTIIRNYTYEAGVRQLNKRLTTLVARYVRSFNEQEPFVMTQEKIAAILGAPIVNDQYPSKDKVGVVNGLYASSNGGGLSFVQVSLMPGSGCLKMSGSLKNMTTESIEAALSYIKSNKDSLATRYGNQLATIDFKTVDIHVHMTRAGTPKDGPSAGLAFCTALISALTQRPVDHFGAMTGEIDLFGNALAIGGIDQKLEGARRNGITYVFVPEENRQDVAAIKELPRDLEIVFVEHVEEVLDRILLNNEQAPVRMQGVIAGPHN